MANRLFERRVRVLVSAPLTGAFGAGEGFVAGAIAGGTGLVPGGAGTQPGRQTEITDLRVQFKVEKNDQGQPNTATLTIYNLSADTRSKLQTKGAYVQLQAGYGDDLGTLCAGDVRTIDHAHDGPDWMTKIELGDGERSRQWARVNLSFRGGTSIVTVLRQVSAAMLLDDDAAMRKLSAAIGDRQFVHGWSAHGPAASELTRLLKNVGYTYSVQDGRLQVLARGETNTEEIVELSSESGLLGSPEYGTGEKDKPPVLKFKCLLRPQIRPGGRLAFASLNHQGTHRVHKVTHDGDTDGSEFYTEGECAVPGP